MNRSIHHEDLNIDRQNMPGVNLFRKWSGADMQIKIDAVKRC
jgi:hypothetical protein